ncbi:hypothetical protein [Glutamicibacter creatinolyticus]|uniref:hypothetical protein n=1 Tax=Glutamicibacter creatinolyticus TaxID=162496 RepID=UPI0031D08F2E
MSDSPDSRPLDGQEGRKFTHNGRQHQLLRLNPDPNARKTHYVPHRPVSVILPVLSAKVSVRGLATVKAQGLIHVLVSDDTGEFFGIWCFAEDTAFDN